ncbi:CheR family methyltransferase [Rivihabitans pingtungensis]|uniref:CheR family methyltransferase n=1 Tax=Rivihabitans pingtungensis TaxID=1054498 RepID=UPI002357F9D5|nr:CheR family methyltransferase [Rivihabitans pingtungensis]MCK6437684.1 chemotaxis protein CheR [Rivihabitans pingtungensis]
MKTPLPPAIVLPKLPPIQREFVFTDDDFDRIRRFIHQRAGIALNPSKKDMVYGRLVRRIRALQLPSFTAYLERLFSERGGEELEHFVNALTTNLTYFFREEHHFPILAEHLRTLSGEVNIWCCAASTGEEPYSLAMTALETASSGARLNVNIVATDLDTNVLRVGAEGIYGAEAINKLPAGMANHYFDRVDDQRWRAKPALRQMIRFQQLNLVDPQWSVRGPFDAIFCRNVMIYFDRDTQLAVLRRFAPLLKPDGLLFVGHSENFYHATDLFRLRGKTVYERVSKA